ncbi:MAG: glutathione S-transferase [Methyloligellaceae bacterium]
MPNNDRPILYSFRRCPYAMRARLAIAASGIGCDLREIVLRDKAPEFLEASPKATVPVLVQGDGTVVDESLDIMDWALARSDPEGWLVPETGTVEEMRALIASADDDFKGNLDRYKYPNRHEGGDAAAARQAGALFLRGLDDRLTGQPYLFGSRACLADMAIVPFVRQFAHVDRAWFDAQGWPHLRDWLDRFLASERFQAIMEKYPKWHAGDPAIVFPPVPAREIA